MSHERKREKSPGVWEVRLEVGRDPLTNRRKQKSETVHGTKREAQKVLNKLVAEADEGKHNTTDATFRQVAERWMSMAEGDLSPTTIRRYRGLLDRHIYPAIGDRPAHKIKATELDDLYQGLISRKGLAPATVRQVHATIRKAMNQAVKWDWVASNPATKTTPPKVPKSEITPPSIEQVQALIALANEAYPQFGRFLHLAVTTGARRGELIALRWERVDFDAGTLVISRSVVETKKGLIEKDTKTHSIRKIALDDQTLSVLTTQRDLMTDLATKAEAKLTQSSFVFSADPGGAVPWKPDHVTKTFQRFRDELDFGTVRLHDLRHFAATTLLTSGVPVRTVSGRLGHANAATTLGTYAHFATESDRNAAGYLASTIGSTFTSTEENLP